MKRLILLSVFSAAVLAVANGAVIDATPGSLESALKNITPTDKTIQLRGQIDVRDMRALAGRKLDMLDMSEAKIVSYTSPQKDNHGQTYYAENQITQYSFFNSEFSTVVIPTGTLEIGAGAFANSAVKSLTLPSGLRVIGDHAFYGCDGLTSVKLPSALTKLGSYAFANDKALETVDMAATKVNRLNPNTFSGCGSLTTVTLPSTLVAIESHAFEGTSILALDLPTVTTLGDYALAGMESLKDIAFGPELTTVGVGVLMDDRALETIANAPENLPSLFAANCNSFDSNQVMNTLTNIGDFSLANTFATELILSPGLTSVGAGALRNVSPLSRINASALGDRIPEVEDNTFEGIDTPNVELGVEDKSVDLWRAHPVWGRFKVTPSSQTAKDEILDVVTDIRLSYVDGLLKIDSPLIIESVEVYTMNGACLLLAVPEETSFEAQLSTDENVLIIRVKTSAGAKTYKLLVY